MKRPGSGGRLDTSRRSTGVASLLLLVGFVATLFAAIRGYGVFAALRPVHLISLLSFVTCLSASSAYRSRRNIAMLLVNCGVLGVCLLFVALFVFLAIAAPFPSQD